MHGSAADQAIAGQRTALNLAGVQVEDLARGMTLARPGVLSPRRSLKSVSLSVMPSAQEPRSRSPARLYSETIAEVALRGVKELKPGASAFAQLRTAEPLLLLPGDRFILRQFSPVVTIGGGVVLDAFPLPRQSKSRTSLSQTLSAEIARKLLLPASPAADMKVFLFAAAVRETGLKQSVLQPMIAALAQQKQIIQVGEFLLSADAMQKTRDKLIAALEAFHKANPLVGGISKEELREKLGLHQTVMEAMLAQLMRDKKVEVAGEQVRLAGRGVELKDEEAKAKAQIEKAFADAGLKVPLMKEVLDNFLSIRPAPRSW